MVFIGNKLKKSRCTERQHVMSLLYTQKQNTQFIVSSATISQHILVTNKTFFFFLQEKILHFKKRDRSKNNLQHFRS